MATEKRTPTFAAIAAHAKVSAHESDGWTVAYFQRHRADDPRQGVPARAYLAECPVSVVTFFNVVVVEVAAAPPTKFAGGGYWEAMLCGMTKADRAVFSDDDYAQVRSLGDEYLARNPRSVI